MKQTSTNNCKVMKRDGTVLNIYNNHRVATTQLRLLGVCIHTNYHEGLLTATLMKKKYIRNYQANYITQGGGAPRSSAPTVNQCNCIASVNQFSYSTNVCTPYSTHTGSRAVKNCIHCLRYVHFALNVHHLCVRKQQLFLAQYSDSKQQCQL